jgi:2-polyprenyl-6-methoxyphenol hydroxylase-like FAD-dependent oxidoreductase
LRFAGVEVDRSIGVHVPGRVVVDRAGQIILEQPLPQIFTAWARLYHLLKAALPEERQHLGKALQSIEQTGASVTAVFSDGSRTSGDLLIGADGFRSTVRALFRPAVKPIYVGYVAWRGLVDEAELSPETHAAVFERLAFCLPPGEQMLGYPVAGSDDAVESGRRRFNFVWYRPADEDKDLPRLLTDVEGRRHDDGIPPRLINREIIDGLLKAADEVLAPQFREVVRKTRHPFLQPIFDLETPELVFGRVVLVGDAAFVTRPHTGMGVTKAGSDARVLTQALLKAGGPTDNALQAYQRDRGAYGHFILGHARHLGAYMQAQLRNPTERAMAERYRTPEAVLRETAVPPVRHP